MRDYNMADAVYVAMGRQLPSTAEVAFDLEAAADGLEVYGGPNLETMPPAAKLAAEAMTCYVKDFTKGPAQT